MPGSANPARRPKRRFFRARRRSRYDARPADIDPWSVNEPWRSVLAQTVGARDRFDAALASWPDGPTRERLVEIQPRLWARVDAIATAARQAAGLAGLGSAWPRHAGPGADELVASLRDVQGELARQSPGTSARRSELERMEESIAARLRERRQSDATAARLLERIQGAAGALDQATSDLIAMAVSSGLSTDMEAGGIQAGIDDDFDAVTDEIRSLAAALGTAEAPDGGETS